MPGTGSKENLLPKEGGCPQVPGKYLSYHHLMRLLNKKAPNVFWEVACFLTDSFLLKITRTHVLNLPDTHGREQSRTPAVDLLTCPNYSDVDGPGPATCHLIS